MQYQEVHTTREKECDCCRSSDEYSDMLTGRLPLLAARTKVLKALAHPTRLFIVERLAQGEHCVCQLAEMIQADMSTVSKHLAVLRNAGIVEDQKRGKQVWYCLAVPCILDFVGCIEETVRHNAEAQLNLVSLQR